jgi:hypothetical protein
MYSLVSSRTCSGVPSDSRILNIGTHRGFLHETKVLDYHNQKDQKCWPWFLTHHFQLITLDVVNLFAWNLGQLLEGPIYTWIKQDLATRHLRPFSFFLPSPCVQFFFMHACWLETSSQEPRKSRNNWLRTYSKKLKPSRQSSDVLRNIEGHYTFLRKKY